MTYGKNSMMLAVGTSIIIAITASCISAQEIPLEKRVQELESKVLYLERQINDLKALVSFLEKQINEQRSPLSIPEGNSSIQKPTPNKRTWKVLANWRYTLQKGMTKQQVISLMGDPDKVEVYSLIGEVWHYGYPGGGTIHFSNSGEVEMWSEPSPGEYK